MFIDLWYMFHKELVIILPSGSRQECISIGDYMNVIMSSPLTNLVLQSILIVGAFSIGRNIKFQKVLYSCKGVLCWLTVISESMVSTTSILIEMRLVRLSDMEMILLGIYGPLRQHDWRSFPSIG
ncbi:hypothetical protein TNCT_334451 [Trichonephila clavata]|uniref:Uncharacterized protein n=1 Tax=Trichonephila clavata TaxID=2740835 RepID=A0A8X6KS37_TRICU|nr:hypothetical protein TNCT_334451 [Trichonephila clavata]